MAPPRTLYQIADEEMREFIETYLILASATNGMATVAPKDLVDERARIVVMAGLGIRPREMSAEEVYEEWTRRQALSFDLETAITSGVYLHLRKVSDVLFDELKVATTGFSQFSPDYIFEHPHFLPFFQHLGGVFSKSRLKEQVGSVSDRKISRPAAERLSRLLNERVDPKNVIKGEILTRLESTLEGIVRDLVGRVFLELIVASALERQNVSFLRESEYESLPGVVYDFRADFVLPNAKAPKVFIEVRKSSSRHASLYAKDKMFSAINWKGKVEDLLAVLVVDGEWTRETLRVMANVFDYVVPIGRIDDLVQTIKAYLEGDQAKLKWLIEFRISPA